MKRGRGGRFRRQINSKHTNKDTVFETSVREILHVFQAGARLSFVEEGDEGKRVVDDVVQSNRIEGLTYLDSEQRTILCFPPTLNGIQRKIVHMVASDLSLFHGSTGEGEERVILVSTCAIDPELISSYQHIACEAALPKPQNKVHLWFTCICLYM